MSKKYIPEGSWLACDKGSCPSTFRISNNNNTNIYGSKLASEADLLPFLNIKPMGICTVACSSCMPAVLKWDNPQEGVTVNNFRLLVEDSTCQCVIGGKIKIYFDRASAAAACTFGEIKMPTEYIKEGFDWMADQTAKSRALRDADSPGWMNSVNHVGDWFSDVTVGLVEGAVNGVVGMGEGIYQIAQDPVGTVEAIGGMIDKADKAIDEGINNAAEWASHGDNWVNAYNSTVAWASNSKNWKESANSAWESTKQAGDWVAKNPRKIGTSVGQFIPDAALAIYTLGGSEAATASRLALREAALLAEEEAARLAEKLAARELAEKEAALLGEKALLKEGEDVVGKVVVKSEAELAEEAAAKKKLLAKEGDVGSYKELNDAGSVGDDITPHHMPSDAYMKKNGGTTYTRDNGVSMNMEQPHPGKGGRHRSTSTYDNNMTKAEQQAYWDLSPRDALAKDIKDARRIYKEDGLYNNEIRNGLREVIKQNKTNYPDIFKK